MTIHETLKQSISEALRAHDEVRLRTLRSLSSAMTNEVIAKKRMPDTFLTDDEAVVVLKRAANQRKDSIDQFEKASRADLAVPETAELMIINSYLPAQMHRDEIQKLAEAKMGELGIFAQSGTSATAHANKLIGALMKDLKGRADGSDVKAVVNNLLAK